ncbi:MAG: SGNH/GDSL hydrolase family protein [Clostridia bacterium]|nr:SGNH/GDSL hydrolase family protein [Clostridia bacterium]
MKLTFEQIKTITKGAVRVEEKNGAVHLFRFTKEQESAYSTRTTIGGKSLWDKTLATAGIRLEFVTSSRALAIEVEGVPASSSNCFVHDVLVNGEKIGSFGENESDKREFSASFELGEGEKEVKIYFPWASASAIRSLMLDDGATIIPVKKSKKMLIYGDSITHGYVAVNPSNSYASRLTDALDAEAFNKAIGGEIFFPELAEVSDEGDFDYITVAYGTNDWSHVTKEYFDETATAFYRALSRRHPNAKIFALAPIWRADYQKVTEVGEFSYMKQVFDGLAKELPNLTVIDCFGFVPADSQYFADKTLHPNDAGFEHYFNGVWNEIQKYL